MPSTQNSYHYAKIIYDLYIKRNLVGIAQGIIQDTSINSQNNDGIDLLKLLRTNFIYYLKQVTLRKFLKI